MKASFRSAIGSPSPEMEPVRVGRVPPGKGTPDVFVIAEENDKPVLRIDVCHLAPEQSAFAECIAWKHWIVVAMIDLKKKRQSCWDSRSPWPDLPEWEELDKNA